MAGPEVTIYLIVKPDGSYLENEYGPEVYLDDADAFANRPDDEHRIEEYRLVQYFDGKRGEGKWEGW